MSPTPTPTPTTYRIYCFDEARHIVLSDWLRASDDTEAVAKAHERGFGSRCEIWDGRRLVAQLESERKQA